MDEVISGGFARHQGPPWSRPYIRVVTWNIERGLQHAGILDFLRAAEADLILLQEVDLNARRTQFRDIASELARSLGVNYVFAKEFLELSEGSGGSPAHHGMATLSPWPLSNARIIRFRRQSSFWKPRWYVPMIAPLQRRLGGRLALAIEAQIYGRTLTAYNMHLESRGQDGLRLQQLKEVLSSARAQEQTSLVVVGRDLNLDAGDGEAAALLHTAGFHDAVRLPQQPTTVPRVSWKRKRAIDWIYVSNGARSQGQVHSTVLASDHHPISATIAVDRDVRHP